MYLVKIRYLCEVLHRDVSRIIAMVRDPNNNNEEVNIEDNNHLEDNINNNNRREGDDQRGGAIPQVPGPGNNPIGPAQAGQDGGRRLPGDGRGARQRNNNNNNQLTRRIITEETYETYTIHTTFDLLGNPTNHVIPCKGRTRVADSLF